MAKSNSIRPRPVPASDFERWADALALLETSYRALQAVESDLHMSLLISPPLRTLSIALSLLHTIAPEAEA